MPTELTPDEMAAIRARHDAATRGEWFYTKTDVGDEEYCIVPNEIHCNQPNGECVVIVGNNGGLAHDSFEGPYSVLFQNAESLTHGRKDSLALLSHADALAAKVARLEGERNEMHETLVELCDMARCPQCLKWVDSVDISTNGDGCDFEPVCADCFDEATHHCVECDFRTSTPKEFETCPTCGGEIAHRDQMRGAPES